MASLFIHNLQFHPGNGPTHGTQFFLQPFRVQLGKSGRGLGLTIHDIKIDLGETFGKLPDKGIVQLSPGLGHIPECREMLFP